MNDSELLELAFVALAPLANLSPDEIKPEDQTLALDVVRLLSERIGVKII